MAKALTANIVKNARPHAERREIADPGCTGLYLIVQTSGHKSWALRYRKDRRSVKLTLGPALIGAAAEPATDPRIGTPLSLAAARELATRTLREIAAGDDPAEQKRQRRKGEHEAKADTLQAVCEKHLRLEASRGLRSLETLRRSDLELFYPQLGARPVDQIRRGEFVNVLDVIAEQRGPRRAARALGSMRTALNWHANRSDHVSVLNRVKWQASATGGRDRVLSDDELRAIWLVAEQSETPFAAFIRFALLTATRRNEAARLRRCELSTNGEVWVIPAARYKQKRDVAVPLSAKAQAIIAAQPVLPRGDFVFSVSGARPINDHAGSKSKFDKICGVTNWRLHDLRRTARTLLSRAGVRPDIGELCLGHRVGGVRGIYDRFEFVEEKRGAFEALAALVGRIVNPPGDVVVPMKAARTSA